MSDPINWTEQRKRLGDLTPWPRNPRQIKSPQAKRLLQSVQEFGQVETLAIGPDGDIYNGHQRLAVLMERYGPDYEVDVRVSSRPLTEKEREKLTVYLHKGAAGEWNFDILANEFEVSDLIEWGFDAAELGIDLTGGTDDDAEPQIDRAEELREQWGVEPGQLWRLPSRTPGQEHRLICGDCTDAAVVERVGIGADMPLFTDPPYGINYDPSWLDGVGIHRQALSSRDILQNDDGSLDLSLLKNHKRRMVWGFPYLYDSESTGWIVWDKQPGVEGRGIVTPIEMAYTTMRTGFDMVRVMWGGYYRGKNEDKQPHPTQKPKGVYEPFVNSWTKPADTIADYFCGSGPTIVVAENLSRQCRAVEISPKYVAVALQRYTDAFGIEPELVTG